MPPTPTSSPPILTPPPQARADSGVPAGAVAVTDAALAALVEDYARWVRVRGLGVGRQGGRPIGVSRPYSGKRAIQCAVPEPALPARLPAGPACLSACVCSEAGVRTLKKHLEKVYRKAALKLVQSGQLGGGSGGDAVAGAADPATVAVSGGSSMPAVGAHEVEQQKQQQAGGSAEAPPPLEAADNGSLASATQQPHPSADPSAADPAAADPAPEPVVYAEPLLSVDVGDLKEFVGQPPYPTDKIYAEGTPAGTYGGSWRGAVAAADASAALLGTGPGCGPPPWCLPPLPAGLLRRPPPPPPLLTLLPGVVMGLAWTSMGGTTLYVEAASVERGEGKGSLKATGGCGSGAAVGAGDWGRAGRGSTVRLRGRGGGLFAGRHRCVLRQQQPNARQTERQTVHVA